MLWIHSRRNERIKGWFSKTRKWGCKLSFFISKWFLLLFHSQAQCGSCYSFATMGMLEARVRIQTNNTQQPVFSPQQVVSCSQYSQGKSMCWCTEAMFNVTRICSELQRACLRICSYKTLNVCFSSTLKIIVTQSDWDQNGFLA